MTSRCLVPPSLTAHWVIWSISTRIRTLAWCLTLWRVSCSRCEISAVWRLFDRDNFAYLRYRRLNSKAVFAKTTGMIILGGGVVKHHISNANLMVITRTQKSTIMLSPKIKSEAFLMFFRGMEQIMPCLLTLARSLTALIRRSARWSHFLGKDPHGRHTCKGKIRSEWCDVVLLVLWRSG